MSLPALLDTSSLSRQEQTAVELFRRQGRLPDPEWEAPVAAARSRYDVGGVSSLTSEDDAYLTAFHSLMGLGFLDPPDSLLL